MRLIVKLCVGKHFNNYITAAFSPVWEGSASTHYCIERVKLMVTEVKLETGLCALSLSRIFVSPVVSSVTLRITVSHNN